MALNSINQTKPNLKHIQNVQNVVSAIWINFFELNIFKTVNTFKTSIDKQQIDCFENT